jgi:hypothetical protein
VSTRLAAAVVLVALGVGCALLAADVRGWSRALAGGDVQYAATPRTASWTPATRLGSVAARLLGVDDDIAVRRALQRYVAAAGLRSTLDNGVGVQTARARAQDALARVAAGGDPARVSQARTLLGILTFGARATGSDQDQVDAATSDFADAIRADPSNDDAKFDLELILRLSAAQGTRTGQGLGGGFGRGGHRGAGGGTPGRGY